MKGSQFDLRSSHILLDGWLCYHDSQLTQFSDDAWCSPARVGLPHPADELPDLRCRRWLPRSSPTAQPRPVLPEALALPGDHGGGLHEHQRLLPAGLHSREPGPEDAVCCSDPELDLRSLEDGRLLSFAYCPVLGASMSPPAVGCIGPTEPRGPTGADWGGWLAGAPIRLR